MFYQGNWKESFPTNHQWSNATLICKGMAPYGAVALEEIDRIIQKLHQRLDEPEAWIQEWSAVAEHVEREADKAAKEGRDATAGNYYMRAFNYYYTGERMVAPGAQKTEVYKKSLRCAHEGFKRRFPNLEVVDVPYEGTALPAYFLKAHNTKGPAPTVVLFDGLDNCKEMSVLFAGIELAHRGFHVLAIDGPGQGEALRLRNLPARFDFEVAGTAAYNWVAARPEVDAKKVSIMAYSAGGYYAPRAAAFEKRYAAVVAWGPHWDYHAVWQKRWDSMQRDPKGNATSHFQLPWVLGVEGMDAAMEKVKKFTLEGVGQLITCPVLVCWGSADKMTPLSVAHQLYNGVGATDKTLKIFTEEDGGAEHCQVDNRQVGTDYICDWLEARFK